MSAGALSLPSNGKGLSANITAVASLQTKALFKWCQKVDALNGLGSSASAAVFSIDQDGTGTNVKIAVGWQTDGSGNIQLRWYVPGVGSNGGANGAKTNLPANGNYLICEIDIINNAQHVNVYQSNGTIISALSGSSAVNGGTNFFPAPGSNGMVTLNKDLSGTGHGSAWTQTAQVYAGLEILSDNTANKTSAPLSNDATGVAAWLLSDATSGSSPSTAAALIGSQGLVLTNPTWVGDTGPWGAAASVPTTATCSPTSQTISVIQTLQLTGTIYDQTSTVMVGEPVTWLTSNSAVATVNATGVVTAVGVGTCTITVEDSANNSVSAICALTVIASPPSVSTLTCTAYATSDTSQPIPGKLANWSSSAPTIAVVDNSGNVTGLAAGSATITGTIDGQSDTCAVTVQ